jgi:hypothetical protein
MPSYVARPHVLADEFVPGYLGDSFGLFPFVHGDPLANQFDGPFLVRLIRKEVTHISGFPFGIESRDPDIPSCWHSGTMRRSCCWSIPCHNQADPLPTNDTPASDIPQRFQCPAMLGDGGVGMGQKEMATTAAGKNRIMIFGPKDDASTSLSLGRPRASWRSSRCWHRPARRSRSLPSSIARRCASWRCPMCASASTSSTWCRWVFSPHVAAYPSGRVHRAVPPDKNR